MPGRTKRPGTMSGPVAKRCADAAGSVPSARRRRRPVARRLPAGSARAAARHAQPPIGSWPPVCWKRMNDSTSPAMIRIRLIQ